MSRDKSNNNFIRSNKLSKIYRELAFKRVCLVKN